MPQTHTKQHGKAPAAAGFTLVELSIVLVIVGLLIGGILAAQSMISTAKIGRTVREIAQMEIAISNFHTLFGQLPGDTTKMGHTADGNGFVGQAFDNYADEMGNLWSDLSLGVSFKNLKGQPFEAFDAGNGFNHSATEQNCARVSLDQDKQNHPCMYLEYMDYYKTHLLIYRSNSPVYGLLKVSDTMALDAKVDDGVGTTGNFFGYPAMDNSMLGDSGATSCYGPGGTGYDLSITGYVCEIWVKNGQIGGGTG